VIKLEHDSSKKIISLLEDVVSCTTIVVRNRTFEYKISPKRKWKRKAQINKRREFEKNNTLL